MGYRKIYLIMAIFLAGSSQVLMTSCQKDYDGQIEILRNQIESGNINLDNLLEKVALIEKQIETLQEAAQEHAELNEKIDGLVEDLSATKTELEGRIAELQKAMNENDLAVRELIEEAKQEFDIKLAELSGRIDTEISAKYNELDGRIRKLEEQFESLQEKQEATAQAISGLKEEIARLEGSQQEEKEKLENALKELEALDVKLTNSIEGIQTQIDALEQAAKENAANLDELREETARRITDLKEEVDSRIVSINAELEGLSVSVRELQETVRNLNTRYDRLDERLDNLIKSYDRQLEEIWDAIGEGDGSEELFRLVETLRNDLNELQGKVNELNEKYLNMEALYGRVENIEEIVAEHTQRIRSLEEELAELGLLVSNLENQIKDMKSVYDALIDDIQDRLEALESGGVPPADLSEMKRMLKELQEKVDGSINDILALKDNQEQQAKLLSELEDKVSTYFLSLNENYRILTGRVDEIYDMVQDALSKIPDLGPLQEAVLENKKNIFDLQNRIKELSGEMDGFVTIEEAEAMLDEYYDKEQINAMFGEVYGKLNDVPNRDEMEKLVETATGELRKELEAMQQDITALQERCTALEEKVDRLFNRIQSMVIIPEYSSSGEVALRPVTGNEYLLAVNVKVNPAGAVGDILNLKNYIRIDSREAIPTRAAGDAGPVFTVKEAFLKDAQQGIFTVKATCRLLQTDPDTQILPFTVAVEFSNSDNDRSTDYVGVRFVPATSEDQSRYEFSAGGEVLKTRDDLGLSGFSEEDIYERAVLGEVNNNGSKVVQIIGSAPVFEEVVVGTSNEIGENKEIPVFYSLAAIYDLQGNSKLDLVNYIQVDAYTGALSMKADLTPQVTTSSLEGYKVVIKLQARKDGIDFGLPAYICVELQNKTGNNI